VVTADVDGDGKADIGIVSAATGGAGRLDVYRSTGTGAVPFPTHQDLTFTGTSEFVLRDLDGDKKADLYLRDETGTEIWRSGTGDGGFKYAPYGTAPQLTATDGHRFADIDGDGLPEIVRLDGGDSASIAFQRNASF
jgi:hypothetical protein